MVYPIAGLDEAVQVPVRTRGVGGGLVTGCGGFGPHFRFFPTRGVIKEKH